jgi:hypothetical protein
MDHAGAGIIYYTPYIGNALPLPNGSGGYTDSTFSQLQLDLGSHNQDGFIYDIFAYHNTGGWVLCTGPAWSSLSSRGTGTGTTELTQVSGIWVNAQASMVCYNDITSYIVPSKTGVYVGSSYMTGLANTDVRLKPAAVGGGPNNILGLWNAYNRVPITAICRDSTANWLYASSSWRAANNSLPNRVFFLDGLKQSQVTGSYSVLAATTVIGIASYTGVDLDSSTATPNITSAASSATGESSASQPVVTEAFYPVLGFHYIQAVEYATGSNVQFFGVNASQQTMALTVSLEM